MIRKAKDYAIPPFIACLLTSNIYEITLTLTAKVEFFIGLTDFPTDQIDVQS